MQNHQIKNWWDNSLTLDGLKGWPSPTAVDIAGTISSNVTLTTVYTGRVVHVASVTQGGGGTPSPGNNVPLPVFEMGAKLTQMPIFLWAGTDQYDVSNPGVPSGTILGGTTANPAAWIPIRPSGNVMGLVAIGGYELETTEFDTDQDYAPNDVLRCVTDNTDTDGGVLTNQDASGGDALATSAQAVWGDPGVAEWESIVGCVSRGSYTNKHGKSALAFWPVYLPGTR